MGDTSSGGKRKGGARISSLSSEGEVRLQGVGVVPATKASALKKGDKVMYNYGSTATVVGIEKKGSNSVILKTKGSNGKIYERTRRANTLIVSNAVRGTESVFKRYLKQ